MICMHDGKKQQRKYKRKETKQKKTKKNKKKQKNANKIKQTVGKPFSIEYPYMVRTSLGY